MPTTQDIFRSGPRRNGVYAGTTLLVAVVDVDPTIASAGTGVVLPKGAIIVNTIGNGGATGGTDPTLNIGNATTANAYANEMDADGITDALGNGNSGAEVLTPLTEDTEIYAGVGSSAATGGTVNATILYYRQDPLNGKNV